MGLFGFLSKGHDSAPMKLSLPDEFKLLVGAAGRQDGNAGSLLMSRAYRKMAEASDAYGTDQILLNGPSALRDFSVALSEKEAQEIRSKTSPEYYGLRLCNLWLRAQQEDSDDARTVFQDLCLLLFQARVLYYASLRDKGGLLIVPATSDLLSERKQFGKKKNFLLIEELGKGCTSQHIVGCILGYADVYLEKLGLDATKADSYFPFIQDERLAKFRVIEGAYIRDGSVKPESMKMIEVGRAIGAEKFREVYKLLCSNT